MWVKVGETFYNTDHIISMARHEDAGVYYIIRFSDGTETGLNPEAIKPLVDAVTRLAEQTPPKKPEAAHSNEQPSANHEPRAGAAPAGAANGRLT